MGPSKRKPKIINSLSKLGLFARVLVKKLTPEEIAQWTKKIPEEPLEECRPSTSICDDSSGDENCIVRKRRRVAYLKSSDSSSSETSSSDFSGSRFKKSKYRRKRNSERRVLPERSARRRVFIPSDDSEEDDLESNLIPYQKSPHRGPLLKSPVVDSTSGAVTSQKGDGAETCSSSNVVTDTIPVCDSPVNTDARVSSSVEAPEPLVEEPPSDNRRNSNEPVEIILRSDPDSPSAESALALNECNSSRFLPSEETCTVDKPTRNDVNENVSTLLSPQKNILAPQEAETRNGSSIFPEENIEDLDKLKKITIINTDEKNVGKIRLRSLQSLGASDSFIKEANLKQSNFRVGKIVHNLYSDHVSQIMAKGLLKKIAENLSEKLRSTEEFNKILSTIHLQRTSKTEIQNEKLEHIVQKRQEYDSTISKLFTQVVESFHSKLEKQNQVEHFPTLLYLGFLYILSNFINITLDRYKKSSLFKNVVLVFTESLRNGNFKYEQIVNFFLTNNFHAHCYKLIEHIGAIQAQNNLIQLKDIRESGLNEQGSVHVPVRKISYKMMNSKMVIEYSKTLEEVETRRDPPRTVETLDEVELLKEPSRKSQDSSISQPPVPLPSKFQTVIPSSALIEGGRPQTSVIVTPPTDNFSSRQPTVSVAPRENNESLTLHNLLTSNKVPKDINIQALSSQNQHFISNKAPKDTNIQALSSQNQHFIPNKGSKDTNIQVLSSPNQQCISNKVPKDINIQALSSQNQQLISNRVPRDINIQALSSQNRHLISSKVPKDINIQALSSQSQQLTSNKVPKDINIQALPSQNQPLTPNKILKDISVQALPSQNQPTSVIHPPQQVNASNSSRPAVRPASSDAIIDPRVKKLSNFTITATPVLGNNVPVKQPGTAVKTPIQVVRPILQTKPSPANMNRPVDHDINKSKTQEFIPGNCPPMIRANLPNVNRPGDHVINTSKTPEFIPGNCQSLVRANVVKKAPAPKVSQNVQSAKPPPAYPGTAVNVVEPAMLQPSVSTSYLQQALISTSNTHAPSNQLPTNQLSKSSSNTLTCQSSNFYQSALQNSSQYMAQNSAVIASQTVNSNFQPAPSIHYQVQQNQGFNSDFSSNAVNSSTFLGNNQIYYSDMLNHNSNQLYYNYVPQAPALSETQVYPQLQAQNQVQNQVQSGAVNQFQPTVLHQTINQPLQEHNQFYAPATPSATVHWQNSSFSNPAMVQSFRNPMQYQSPYGSNQ